MKKFKELVEYGIGAVVSICCLCWFLVSFTNIKIPGFSDEKNPDKVVNVDDICGNSNNKKSFSFEKEKIDENNKVYMCRTESIFITFWDHQMTICQEGKNDIVVHYTVFEQPDGSRELLGILNGSTLEFQYNENTKTLYLVEDGLYFDLQEE